MPPDPAERQALPDRSKPCMAEAFGGPCGRRTGHGGHHATIGAHHLDEKDDLRAEIEALKAEIRRVDAMARERADHLYAIGEVIKAHEDALWPNTPRPSDEETR